MKSKSQNKGSFAATCRTHPRFLAPAPLLRSLHQQWHRNCIRSKVRCLTVNCNLCRCGPGRIPALPRQDENTQAASKNPIALSRFGKLGDMVNNCLATFFFFMFWNIMDLSTSCGGSRSFRKSAYFLELKHHEDLHPKARRHSYF